MISVFWITKLNMKPHKKDIPTQFKNTIMINIRLTHRHISRHVKTNLISINISTKSLTVN